MKLLPAFTGRNHVYHNDALSFLRGLGDKSVDALSFEGKVWYNQAIEKVRPRATNTGRMSNQKGLGAMADYITRPCPVCGVDYLADPQRLKHGRQTTCSRECSYKYRAMQTSVQSIELTCLDCGKTYYRKPGEKHGLKFCSLECYFNHRNPDHIPLDNKCAVCGTGFRSRHNKYCSRKCFELAHKSNMVGENNPSYIDGRSLNNTYDAGIKWKDIRLAVYKRDNYTCQKCGVKCVSKAASTPETSHRIIQCHHIDPYKQSKNNDLSNLETLCLRCHRYTHNDMWGYKRATSA